MKKLPHTSLPAIVVLLCIAGGLFFWFFKQTFSTGFQSSQQIVFIEDKKNNIIATESLEEIYTNDKYRFSLKFPKGLSQSSFSDPSGDIIIIADTKTGFGFQIRITPFDEDPSVITSDRIKQDIPDIIIREPRDVLMGDSGKGIAFLDGNESTANRQVWFALKGNLYQITAPINFDLVLQKILNTWKFF